MHLITTRTALLGGAALLLTAAAAVSSRAQDYSVGANARTFAMGGAGIALAHYPGANGRANPASLAFENKKIGLTTPSLGFRSDGAGNTNVASNFLIKGARPSDAVSIAHQYGTDDANYGVNGYTAVRTGKFEVSAGAVGIAHVQPNAAWKNWLANGQDFYNTLPANARTEFYSAGYITLPGVAYASAVPGNFVGMKNDLAVGLRVKQMQGIYSHLTVQKDFDTSGQPFLSADPATEMNGKNQLKQRGIGADLGILISPKLHTGFSYGFVANNLLKPSFTFKSVDRNGNTHDIDIIQRSYGAGAGWVSSTGRTAAAADIVNIGSGVDLEGVATEDERVGVEQWVTKRLALRGGYSRVNGATYGLGFYGVNVAFGGRVPLEVGRTLNF